MYLITKQLSAVCEVNNMQWSAWKESHFGWLHAQRRYILCLNQPRNTFICWPFFSSYAISFYRGDCLIVTQQFLIFRSKRWSNTRRTNKTSREKGDQHCHVYRLLRPQKIRLLRDYTCIHWDQASPEVFQDLAQHIVEVYTFSPKMWLCILYICR